MVSLNLKRCICTMLSKQCLPPNFSNPNHSVVRAPERAFRYPYPVQQSYLNIVSYNSNLFRNHHQPLLILTHRALMMTRTCTFQCRWLRSACWFFLFVNFMLQKFSLFTFNLIWFRIQNCVMPRPKNWYIYLFIAGKYCV
jgi:hypothetical protein